MNCPKCKNSISDNSQECEWCGVKINKPNTQKKDFNIDEINAQFEDIFGVKVVKSINKVQTLCPNCKNINLKNLSECEYCDTNLKIN
jgi:hypothetical protein